MKYQQSAILGRALSYVGLGTVKLGRNLGVKYPEAFSIPDDQAARHLLETAKQLGINVIDTAPAYGGSEMRLGKLLAGQREDWVIVSKAGESFSEGRSTFDFSADAIRDSVLRTLKRLNTSYLDVLLIHSDGRDEAIIQDDQVFVTLGALKQAGIIKSFGMSVKTVAGGLLTLKHADSVMVTLNPFETDCAPVLEAARGQGKLIFIKKAFASGHVYMQKNAMSAQAIFDYLARYEAITSVIVGTINPGHLAENVRACETNTGPKPEVS